MAVLVTVALMVGMTLALPEAAARRSRVGKSGLTRAQRKARKKAVPIVKLGVLKLREGDYVAALELFTKAHEIYPSPKIQFNIGQTYKELGRYLDAMGAYEIFLRDAPASTSEALRKLARDNIRDLFRKISLLRVRVSVVGAEISIDGQPRGVSQLDKPLRLMPGVHSMVVKKKGYVTVVVDLQLGAGKQVSRTVTLHKPPPKVIWKVLRKPIRGLPVLWTAVALVASAGVVAAITGGLAVKEDRIVHDLDLPIAEREASATRGKRYQLATDGLLLGVGVLAVSALIWYLVVVRPSGGIERVRVKPKKSAVMPFVTPGGGGLVLRF
jgi:PEGA domain